MNPQNQATPRPLTRSRSDRMLAGVAGGIAQTYGFDPALVRLAFVVLALATLGTGAVAYVIAWLVVPEADADEPVLSAAVRDARHRPHDRRLWIGIVLVLVGTATLADRFRFDGVSRVVWPLLLIGGGAAVLLLRERDVAAPSVAPPPAPPGASAPSGPSGPSADPGSNATVAPSVTDATDATDTAETTDAAERAGSTFGPLGPPEPPSAYPPSLPWPQPPRPPRKPRPPRAARSMLGRFTWSALLIVAGGAWLIDLTGAASVDARFVLAVELGIVGVALLVGAWFGRSRGLIAVGLLLTVFAGTFAALDVPLRGDIGEHVVRPAAMSELDHRYRLAIGHLELDLGGTPLDQRGHRVVLTDAIGYLEIVVPADARVEVIARTDVGSLSILGRPTFGGTHEHADVVDDPPGSSGPRLVIDAHVGFGAVNVTRFGAQSARGVSDLTDQEVSS